MFAISVEFLFGTYRGDPDGTANMGRQQPGEWPPAPSRLFSALVAADGTRDACHVTDGRELCWFERLPAPRVHADARVNHQPLHTRYVVKHASGQGIGAAGRAKWAQKEYVARGAAPVRPGTRVSVRDPRVVYRWEVAPPPAEILASLRRRAARVGYLGAADSPVRLRVGEEPAGRLPAAWEPDENGDIVLGVPQPGDVGVLDRMHDQWRQRGASVARLQFPALHRQTRYRSPGHRGSERSGGEVVAWLRLAEPVAGRRIGVLTGL
ncbi:MAG: type I-U CRISPR-associated protein Cas5/Cas6, partial [Gammaproteobacteria bacterium]|nr:type I-U CRISPR-associated protein Cas5/Cas6 [Gammaproteobacteria bacterium]